MHGGQIVQVGAPMEIYKEPANLFVAGFVGTTNVIQGRALSNEANNSGRVETAIGPFRCPLPSTIKAGQPVSVMFRPEAVVLHTEQREACENLVSGTVKSAVFTGNRVGYEIDSGGFHIRAETSPYVAELTKGDSMCGWNCPLNGCGSWRRSLLGNVGGDKYSFKNGRKFLKR